MKYSIILPYYDRLPQLLNTLASFSVLYKDRNDYEVIIVEDKKQTDLMRKDLQLNLWSFAKIKITCINSQAEKAYNPATAYNEGAKAAQGEYFILSSPECKHNVNILKALDKEFTKDVYVVCACLSLKEDGNFHMWYQHSVHRDLRYHFCSAISKENYFKIDGFDERYTKGYGYDDNSFRDKVINAGIPFSIRDDLLVIHQHHKKVRPKNYKQLLQRNKQLYEKGVTHA